MKITETAGVSDELSHLLKEEDGQIVTGLYSYLKHANGLVVLEYSQLHKKV